MRLLPDENKNKRKKIVENKWERTEKQEEQDEKKSSLLERKTNTLEQPMANEEDARKFLIHDSR